jgi:drug/metabolite transporter (DMT)-like permease
MNDLLEKKLVEILDQLQHGAVQAAQSAKVALPQLTEIALRTVQWDGAWHLLLGLGLLLASPIAWKLTNTITKLKFSDEADRLAASVIGMAASIGLVIAAGFQLFDMWNWVAILDPKAKLAHDILVGVLSKFDGSS